MLFYMDYGEYFADFEFHHFDLLTIVVKEVLVVVALDDDVFSLLIFI